MKRVKQFTDNASLPHVLMHAALITLLAVNMVMRFPAFG